MSVSAIENSPTVYNLDNGHDGREGADSVQASGLLVIATGNSLRADDGAGLVLAEQLVQWWQNGGISVRHIAMQQLVPELALLIADAKTAAVIFVDASTNPDSSEIQICKIASTTASPSLGHHSTPQALLLYAKMLYHREPLAWLVTVPGKDFSHNEVFSPDVRYLLTTAYDVAEKLQTQFIEIF